MLYSAYGPVRMLSDRPIYAVHENLPKPERRPACLRCRYPADDPVVFNRMHELIAPIEAIASYSAMRVSAVCRVSGISSFTSRLCTGTRPDNGAILSTGARRPRKDCEVRRDIRLGSSHAECGWAISTRQLVILASHKWCRWGATMSENLQEECDLVVPPRCDSQRGNASKMCSRP